MADMAIAWKQTGAPVWFITPNPKSPFVASGGRPTMWDLLHEAHVGDRPTLVTQSVSADFEFGTERYRAHTYASLIARNVPVGVPVIVSDDAAAWAAAASMTSRNPLIGVLHSDGANYYALGAKYAEAAGALVCVSKRIEDTLRSRLVGFATSIAMAPCGTPLPPPPRREERNSLLRLAWVGRICELEKRVSDLPKIAAALRQSGISFHLDIVGDGPERDMLETSFQVLQLHSHVTFHGWLAPARVRATMAAADVLLLPSNYEGMPVVVMEALAVGCGVVASRVSGIEDLEHCTPSGRCLLVHDVGDVRSAVACVKKLWALGPAERARAARSLVEAELSIEVCVQRYIDIIGRAASTTNLVSTSIGAAGWTRAASLAVSSERRARIWVRGLRGHRGRTER